MHLRFTPLLAAFACCFMLSSSLAQVPLSITTVTTNVSCNGAQNGAVTTSVIGGNSPYTYLWSDGQTTSSIQNLSAGVFGLTVTDAVGGIATTMIVITQPTQLGATSFASDQICDVAPQGTAVAVPYGGTPPYSYVWSNGANTATIQQLSAGAYTVTLSDAQGCTATSTCTVLFTNEGVWVGVESTDATCGDQNGTAHAGGMSGVPPYTYLWSNGATTQDIAGLSPGIYSVQVTDASGCANQFPAQVVIAQQPGFTVAANMTPETCYHADDGSISLSLNNIVSPYNVQWSNGANGTVLQNLAAGLYIATITDATPCSRTEQYLVDVNWPPSCGDTLTAIIDSCQNCPSVLPDGFDGHIRILEQCAANNDLSDPLQGLCAVHLRFEHEFVGDLVLRLRSPAGQIVQLVGPVSNTGASNSTISWDVMFQPCAGQAYPDGSFSETWSNDQAWGGGYYTGNYYPYSGCLEDFNLGPVNGYWTLLIEDGLPLHAGFIQDVDLIFCDDQAEPSCTPTYPPVLSVDLMYSVLGDSLHCSGLLSNHTGFEWTFDGLYSASLNPVFPLEAGLHTLTLTAWNDTDTSSKTVEIQWPVLGVAAPGQADYRVGPNPFSTELTVESAYEAAPGFHLVLLDRFGRTVRNVFAVNGRCKLDGKGLTAGIYFLEIRDKTGRTVRKVTKI